MTDPIESQYQATPWQPTVYSGSGDTSDQDSAAKTYDSDYGGQYSTASGSGPASTPDTTTYYDPTLSMAYTKAPDLIPLPNTGAQSSGGAPPATDYNPFSIQLGYLMSSEQTCLDATSTTVQGYQTLSSVVSNAISSDSIFGQVVGTYSKPNPDKKVSWNEPTGVTYDKLDSEGTAFASAIIPQMKQLLEAVGNITEAMGQFTALLNTTGQMYTDTDAQSAFPPPGLMQGPNPQSGTPSS